MIICYDLVEVIILNKDLDKLLSSTIRTYVIILIGIFILKLCGLDYFGLDTNNEIIQHIDNFIGKFHLQMIWYGVTLYIYQYIIFSISAVDNSKKMKVYTLCTLIIAVAVQQLKMVFNNTFLFSIIDLTWLFVAMLCYIRFVKKENIHGYNIGNYWLFMFLNLIFQLLSVVIRDIHPTTDYNNFAMSFIANFDYILLSIISYHLFFTKGGKSLWVGVVSLYSHLLTLSRDSLTKLQDSYLKSKKRTKLEKVSDAIYIPLFILWNFFTLFVVLFVATLNHTFIECCIILSSFWINKKTFGKAFHMKTAKSCFIVSNLIYYSLNRITLSSGISLLISVFLGIALCCITSKFVKDKKLYRGMSLEEYDKMIENIFSKNSSDYDICKLFYVDRQSEVYIANKYKYTIRGFEDRKRKLKNQIERQ